MKKLLFVLTLALGMMVHAQSNIKNFIIDDPGGRNTAKFESKAPLEQVVGTTNAVTGFIAFDPDDVIKTAKGEITVDVSTLKTGIALRDEHMRSKDYLDTSQFPKSILKIVEVRSGDRTSIKIGETLPVVAKGVLSLHGVEREIEVTGTVGYFAEVKELASYGYPGEMINVDASFKIKLSDFDIKRPQFLFLKLSEDILVSVNFTATTGRTAK